ncbi:hypothetical protein I4F81_003005 [Pyropia yezoensis]|uniref:Uncharacterized protein n=1 Tax=Pyropia yezoensis TaxID=2788 RepID=A0ACC3BQY7_PYRYE|nr:hypothetical protein I4F81_003005 [Neopyropia yezoensis]
MQFPLATKDHHDTDTTCLAPLHPCLSKHVPVSRHAGALPKCRHVLIKRGPNKPDLAPPPPTVPSLHRSALTADPAATRKEQLHRGSTTDRRRPATPVLTRPQLCPCSERQRPCPRRLRPTIGVSTPRAGGDGGPAEGLSTHPRARAPHGMSERRGGYNGPSKCGSTYGQPGLGDGGSDVPEGPRGGVSGGCPPHARAPVTAQSGESVQRN